MDSNTVTISELISGMLAEVRRLGMSKATIWREWEPKANSVVMYYRKRGLCVYSSEVTEEYLKSCEQRYAAGELNMLEAHEKHRRVTNMKRGCRNSAASQSVK